MNRRTWLCILACALLASLGIPLASANPGYIETFTNGQPPSSNWYTYASGGANDWVVSAGRFVAPNVASFTNANLFTMQAVAIPAATADWDFNFTYTITRNVNTVPGAGIGPGLYTAGGFSDTVLSTAWGGAGNAFRTFAGASCSPASIADTSLSHTGTFAAHFTKATNTVTLTWDKDTIPSVCTSVNANWQQLNAFRFHLAGTPVFANGDKAAADNVVFNPNNGASFTPPKSPRPPAGLSAFVKQGWTGSQSQVELRWPLSPDDPNPINGTFQYYFYTNGVRFGPDDFSAFDGGGSRYHLLLFTGTAPVGLSTYWIVASDQGFDSVPSCTVAVDDRNSGEAEVCGNINPIGTATNTISAGNALIGFAASIGFPSPADQFLFGLILLAIVMCVTFAIIIGMTRYGKDRRPMRDSAQAASLPTAIVGTVFMVFLGLVGLWPTWTAILLIGLSAAAITAIIVRIYGFGG